MEVYVNDEQLRSADERQKKYPVSTGGFELPASRSSQPQRDDLTPNRRGHAMLSEIRLYIGYLYKFDKDKQKSVPGRIRASVFTEQLATTW